MHNPKGSICPLLDFEQVRGILADLEPLLPGEVVEVGEHIFRSIYGTQDTLEASGELVRLRTAAPMASERVEPYVVGAPRDTVTFTVTLTRERMARLLAVLLTGGEVRP